MLRGPARRRRTGQRGQTLILALAFIGFFGFVVVSVLRFADVAALQHVHTEATQSTDSSVEGGAAYAAADAARSRLTLVCKPGETAQLTMQGGARVSYVVNQCNPGNTASLGGDASAHCVLCVLNQVAIGSVPPGSPQTRVVTADDTTITTTGGSGAYINGSIASGSSVVVLPSASAYVNKLLGASSAGCDCMPSVRQYTPAIADPLAGVTMSASAPEPSGCPDWTPNGCRQTITGDQPVSVNPGLWSSLAIGGQATVTLTAGTYVFTGPLAVSDEATVGSPSPISIYLTCSGGCQSPRAGGSIDLSGDGAVQLQGQQNGVAVLTDPNLRDPDAPACLAGSNGACVFQVMDVAVAITGTVDTRSGGLSVLGDSATTIGSGRLVTNSVFVGDVDGPDASLSVTDHAAALATSCTVFDDLLNNSSGTAIVQSHCGAADTSGVVDFNYTP